MRTIYQFSLMTFLAASTTFAQGTGVYSPITPCRILDTRNANGDFGGPAIAANTYRTIPVRSSTCLPSGSNPEYMVAYVLNVTVVPIDGTPVTYLQVRPTGGTFPAYTMMESADALVYAHGAIVPAGTNGSITILSIQATHLVIDISGYFSPVVTAGGAFKAVTPCRAVDTRPSNTINAGGYVTYDMTAGGCTGAITYYASAYILNVTVIPKNGFLGFLTAYPAYATRPNASTINSIDGSVLANFAIVPGGGDTNRYVSFYASDSTDVVVDVVGYFTSSLTGIGTVSYWVNDGPGLVMDTLSGSPITYETTASASLPNYSFIDGWFLDVSAVGPQWALSFLTAWQYGVTRPTASTLNDGKGLNMSNSAVIPQTGGVSIYPSATTHARVAYYGHFEHAH